MADHIPLHWCFLLLSHVSALVHRWLNLDVGTFHGGQLTGAL